MLSEEDQLEETQDLGAVFRGKISKYIHDLLVVVGKAKNKIFHGVHP